MKKVKWMSGKPRECDICHKELKESFVDGRTVYGPWGIMCNKCFKDIGVGLGLGKGQKYDIKSLEKIEG